MDVVVAAFDVDNTLTVRDCVVPFMQRVAGRGGFIKACVSSPLALSRMVLQRERDSIKAYFVNKTFAGKDVESVNQIGIKFAADVVSSWMREDVARRMRWHQAQGHVVVLVSASLEPYLQPLGDLCEVDAVLCTRLEENSGIYTGSINGKNCRGDEKVARIREWMSASGLSNESLMYAYGDSAGDSALLEFAQNGFLVKKVDSLEEYA